MSNPWLSIPLEDYERHMGSEGAQQLQALSDLFKRVLDLCRPESVAVLGVAGGNGLEQIDGGITKRIVGVDINAQYLDEVRRRYGALAGLELHGLDLGEHHVNLASVELVHAALFFEHAGLCRSLDSALSLVAPGGRLSVILQLPSDAQPGVTSTHYASMQKLKDSFSLVDIAEFQTLLGERGFHLVEEEHRSLPAGKAFWLGIFASSR